jgi:hypothetical protein
VVDPGSARFGAFLERSLRLLAREAPAHFAAVRAKLQTTSINISLDGAAPICVQLAVEPWVAPASSTELTAAISQRDLIDLLQGAFTIDAAILTERLQLRGPLDDLLGFLDALHAWLHGAVRCPSFAALHLQYIEGAAVER